MKEIILKEREFKEKLVQVINESSLPAFIIKPTLKELYEQVLVLEERQYEQAKNDINKKENERKEKSNEKN